MYYLYHEMARAYPSVNRSRARPLGGSREIPEGAAVVLWDDNVHSERMAALMHRQMSQRKVGATLEESRSQRTETPSTYYSCNIDKDVNQIDRKIQGGRGEGTTGLIHCGIHYFTNFNNGPSGFGFGLIF